MQGRRSCPKNGLKGRASYLCFRAKMPHGREAEPEIDKQPDLRQKLTPGVIQGYPTEARRIRWGKVLHHLQRVYASQRSDQQLKHRWADLITREQDLLDHLGIVIGGTVGEYELC
ncbi:hypothetical protein NDU88_007246 [Pleurodeles waltl]|uniref:Uncharacterized protein n=1 Tax=Pleurodeles waltl TaxID=8319 RepID=A0AAV7SRZ0_PLEWA|nr:hypothetical protein NDU88_007246 [Pleurodeles waltl]